ncbi:MAG: glycoside hydrolase family 3 protein, partial [Isosphaeraceae bacterium]
LGHWRADGKTADVVSLHKGIQEKVATNGGRPRVSYARGCAAEGVASDDIAKAARVASQADVATLAVGETASMSGEASSRTSLDLTARQRELVQAVHATGTKTVVVLMSVTGSLPPGLTSPNRTSAIESVDQPGKIVVTVAKAIRKRVRGKEWNKRKSFGNTVIRNAHGSEARVSPRACVLAGERLVTDPLRISKAKSMPFVTRGTVFRFSTTSGDHSWRN